NEGINSIVKKRGDIIGDGQRTSWLHGAKVIGPRYNAIIAGIKIVALIGSKITGKIKHCMKWMHNWRRSRIIFVFMTYVVISRETPPYYRNKNDLLLPNKSARHIYAINEASNMAHLEGLSSHQEWGIDQKSSRLRSIPSLGVGKFNEQQSLPRSNPLCPFNQNHREYNRRRLCGLMCLKVFVVNRS
nr:hypothetical protein [Candidatus Sigynarchaeum springense]